MPLLSIPDGRRREMKRPRETSDKLQLGTERLANIEKQIKKQRSDPLPVAPPGGTLYQAMQAECSNKVRLSTDEIEDGDYLPTPIRGEKFIAPKQPLDEVKSAINPQLLRNRRRRHTSSQLGNRNVSTVEGSPSNVIRESKELVAFSDYPFSSW